MEAKHVRPKPPRPYLFRKAAVSPQFCGTVRQLVDLAFDFALDAGPVVCRRLHILPDPVMAVLAELLSQPNPWGIVCAGMSGPPVLMRCQPGMASEGLPGSVGTAGAPALTAVVSLSRCMAYAGRLAVGKPAKLLRPALGDAVLVPAGTSCGVTEITEGTLWLLIATAQEKVQPDGDSN